MLKQQGPNSNKGKLMLQYVKEFETSNLTQSAFCKQHNISHSTFYRWKNKYVPALIATNKKNNKYTFSKKITDTQPSKISNLNFIEVPNDNINTSIVHNATACVIKRTDGTQLTINCIEKQQLESLLEVFLCYK